MLSEAINPHISLGQSDTAGRSGVAGRAASKVGDKRERSGQSRGQGREGKAEEEGVRSLRVRG